MIRESWLVVLPEDRRPACAQLHKRSEFGALQLSVFNHNSRRIHLPPGLCLCPERPVDSVSDFAREMNALNLDHAPVPRSISFPPSLPAVIKGQRRPRCTGCPTQNKDSLRTILDPIPIGSARTVELQSGITIWRFSVKTPIHNLGSCPATQSRQHPPTWSTQGGMVGHSSRSRIQTAIPQKEPIVCPLSQRDQREQSLISSHKA